MAFHNRERLNAAVDARIERHSRDSRQDGAIERSRRLEESRQHLFFGGHGARDHAQRAERNDAAAVCAHYSSTFSSSSFSASRAIDTARSSPSMSIRRTPWVARPMLRIEFDAMRR